jgi:ABC-type lipoprotein export system ATPase subunit
MAGRTTILITHDWALAQQADTIYTLPSTGPEDPGPAATTVTATAHP